MPISLDTAISIGGLVVSTVSLYVALNSRITKLETMLQPIWDWWNKDDPKNGNGNGNALDEKIEQSVRNVMIRIIPEVYEKARRELHAK